MRIAALAALCVLAVAVAVAPAALADHPTASVTILEGASSPDCNPCLEPERITVDLGGDVIFTNEDTVSHTILSGTPDEPIRAFEKEIPPDSTLELEAEVAGEWPFYSRDYPHVKGVIIVNEDAAHGDEDYGDEKKEMDKAMKEDDDYGDEEHGDERKGMDMDAMSKPSATGMMSDKTMVNVWASKPATGERMEITYQFMDGKHVNFNIMATQDGETVLDDGVHTHEGSGAVETAPLESEEPVDITIEFTGYGVEEPFEGPIGDKVMFAQVVPEFGTIAMMILAVSAVGVIAMTARSRMTPRF